MRQIFVCHNGEEHSYVLNYLHKKGVCWRNGLPLNDRSNNKNTYQKNDNDVLILHGDPYNSTAVLNCMALNNFNFLKLIDEQLSSDHITAAEFIAKQLTNTSGKQLSKLPNI